MESTQTQTQRDSLAIAKKNFDQMDPKLQEKKVGWAGDAHFDYRTSK